MAELYAFPQLYDHMRGLIVTGNYLMRNLVERERMHPAIVRRMDDICRVIELLKILAATYWNVLKT